MLRLRPLEDNAKPTVLHQQMTCKWWWSDAQTAAGELDGTEAAGGYLKVDLNTAPRTPGGGGGSFGGGGRGGFGGRGGGRGGRGGGRFDGGGRGRFGDSGRGGRGGELPTSCGYWPACSAN